jgi:hypothetical membrane protein
VVVVRGVPWWGLASSAAAPVLIVGGWSVAAGLQPHHFDPVSGSISALAAAGVTDRWVLTLALLGVGACHIITGLALRPAALAGRLILMTGGLAAIMVAANPEHARGVGTLPHTFWATLGFTALAVWPIAGWKRGPSVPYGLRPAVAVGAAAVQLCLLAWFDAEVITAAAQVGLAERVLAVAQAIWPLAVVVTCRWSQSARHGLAAAAASPPAVG